MTAPPTRLLLPGNMCDATLWAPLRTHLDDAGIASTVGGPLDQPSIAAMAEAMLSRHAGPLLVIGFSMGAIVAATMAAHAPGRITGLGLLAFNAAADLPERAAVRPRQQAEARGGRLAAIVADELKPNYLAEANRADAELRATLMAMAIGLGPEVFVRQSEALRTRDDLRPALPGFAMPVLLATGREDRLCPPDWHRDWQAAIGTHATLHIVEGAGHMLPLEQPRALARMIVDWIETEELWARPS